MIGNIHKVLRLQEVIRITGMGRSSIYKWMSEGTFPSPLSLGIRSVGWLEADIQEWLGSRIKLRSSTSKQKKEGDRYDT